MYTFAKVFAILSVLILLVACQPIVALETTDTTIAEDSNASVQQDDATLREENKAVMRQFLDITWNERSTDAIGDLLTPNATIIGPDMTVGDPASVKLMAAAFLAGFSDFHMEVQEQVAEDDVVVTRWLVTGTHDGEFMGIPPTGNEIQLAGMTWTRHVDGKMDMVIDAYDFMALMRQLGQ